VFEEDDGSVMVEAVTIDVMTLGVAAVALAEVDVMTLGGVIDEVALSEVEVPWGVTVSRGPVTPGWKESHKRCTMAALLPDVTRLLALSCSRRSSTGRVSSCVMVAVDHEGGSDQLKAPRLAWTVLDFFVWACWVGRVLLNIWWGRITLWRIAGSV